MNYALTSHNKSVWEFYDKHKNINFEDINVIFVQILDKLLQDATPSLTPNVASQLLDSIKSLQTQVSTISESYTKINSDMNTNFTLKFVEFKREYMEDLKVILSNNTLRSSYECSISNSVKMLRFY